MSTELDKLRRQVAVLREALEACADEHVVPGVASDALAEADRIAAEPTEATDAEVVASWVDRGHGGIGLDTLDGPLEWFDTVAQAAAWVRAQGGAS